MGGRSTRLQGVCAFCSRRPDVEETWREERRGVQQQCAYKKLDFKYYLSPKGLLKGAKEEKKNVQAAEQLVSQLRSSEKGGLLLVGFVSWESPLPRQARLEAREL